MVQAARRARLAEESPAVRIVESRVAGQHFHCDATAERLLHGFVHDAHPAAADLSEDAEVAQALQPRRAGRASRVFAFLTRPHFLERGDRRKQIADLVRQLGMIGRVLLDGRHFAMPLALHEVGGEHFERIAVGLGGEHART